MRHCASTSSLRVNSVGSPRIASMISRSYASGDCDMNEVPYRNSIFTERIRMRLARDLRAELQRDALIGLEREDQLVGFDSQRPILGESQMGDRLQRDGDLGDLAAKRLPARR